MKILIIHGPNLTRLGKRNPAQYGTFTLDQINSQLVKLAKSSGIDTEFFQSNHEGAIIDFLQSSDKSRGSNGILINPGALTHYGYSLRDALEDTKLPIVEVHLSDVDSREPFRKIDVLDGIVIKKISGRKEKSYYEGFQYLINYLKNMLSSSRPRNK